MLSLVELAFVGRYEKRAPVKNACVGGYVNGHYNNIDDIKISRVNALCKLTCCSTICI